MQGPSVRRCYLVAITLAMLSAPGTICCADTQVQSPAQPLLYKWKDRTLNESQYQAILKYQEATKDITAGKWQAAADKLKQVTEVMPDLYEAHTNLAVALTSLGKLDEALAEANVAYKLAPDKPEPMLAKATTCQSLGKLDEAFAVYKEFISKFPSHKLAPQVRGFIDELGPEIAAQKIAKSQSAKAGGDDYFEYTTLEAVTKWSSDHFPLKIYIPPDSKSASIPGYKPEYAEAARSAFEQWRDKSNGILKFDFVDNPDGADIVVRFTNDVSQVKTPAEGGDALVAYDGVKGVQHATITLLTVFAGAVSSKSANHTIEVAALHEVGHSLGLIGHSPNPDDVMYCALPAADQSKPLSERDGRTLVHLYQPDVALAIHLHPQTGGVVTKATLNNEGTQYAAERNFPEAAKRFEAALRLDPHFDPARQNLASCLNNMGIAAVRAGQIDEGIGHLRRALELVGSGDAKKRASVMQNLAYALQKGGKTSEADALRTQAAQVLPAK